MPLSHSDKCDQCDCALIYIPTVSSSIKFFPITKRISFPTINYQLPNEEKHSSYLGGRKFQF